MIKYGVWFHGTDNEPESICYRGREPFVTDDIDSAIEHMVYLQDVAQDEAKDKFSIVELHIRGVNI